MKRTCNGCKAVGNLSSRDYCTLGYKTKHKRVTYGLELLPSEECPKPMTNKKIIECDHKGAFITTI